MHVRALVRNLLQTNLRQYSSSSATSAGKPHVCVVGSGPAGFALAQTLLKNNDLVQVDMFEKLPVPFGLIRYGVSPDHQDVKNCINGYSKTAESSRFSFYGNVNVGTDVTVENLLSAYHAVVLCHGSQGERNLRIPGSHLSNIFTSNQFVGWYNGHPEYQNINPDLSGRNAIMIGVGNVALDCARMLLKPVGDLHETDITSASLNSLSNSTIDNVHIVGRRGLLQMACTRKELSEICGLSDVATVIDSVHFSSELKSALKVKDLKKRKVQRLVKYLMKVAKDGKASDSSLMKQFLVHLLMKPVEVLSEDGKSASAVKFQLNKLSGDAFSPEIISTEDTVTLPCDLLISCIGYGQTAVQEPAAKYTSKLQDGVVDMNAGLYSSGWCNIGATGVLADTSNDSLATGQRLLSHLPELMTRKPDCQGFTQISAVLGERGGKRFSWQDWEKIDSVETQKGALAGKVREKVTCVDEMFEIATSS